MNYRSIVRVLAMLGLIMSATLVVTGLVAIAVQEWVQLAAIGISILFLSVLSASILLLTPVPQRKSTPRDGLAVLVLWWCLSGLFGALPFIFDTPAGDFTAAIHEAVSSLTTTGHTVILGGQGDGEWPTSLLVWRAMLHLQGAIVSLIAAASIFAALNLGGPGIHKTVLFTIHEKRFFDALSRVALAAVLAVIGLALVVGLLLAAAGQPLLSALLDGVSVATTGLVAPDSLSGFPESSLHRLVIFVGLLIATLGLAVWLEARAFRWRLTFNDPELRLCFVLILGFAGLASLTDMPLLDGLGWALSSLSTSGLPLTSIESTPAIPLILAITPALIGGSALSTAGGIKLARLSLLGARAGEEFARLGFRDSVVAIRFRGTPLPDAAVIGIWVYLVAYLFVLAVLMAGFSLCNLSFEDSLSAAVGGLSNSGALVDLSASRSPQASDLLALIAMILGRLEIIALIPALTPNFWRD